MASANSVRKLLADGTVSDPFVLGYELFRQDRIVTAQHDANGVNLTAYVVTGDPTAGTYALSIEESLSFGEGSGPVEMVNLRVSGDSAEYAAVLYGVGATLKLALVEKNASSLEAKSVTAIATTLAIPFGDMGSGWAGKYRCTFQIKTGRFLSSSTLQILIAWQDQSGAVTLEIWDPANPASPVRMTASEKGPVATQPARDGLGNGLFRLATGDLDLDGLDEIAMVWAAGTDPTSCPAASLDLYKATQDGGGQLQGIELRSRTVLGQVGRVFGVTPFDYVGEPDYWAAGAFTTDFDVAIGQLAPAGAPPGLVVTSGFARGWEMPAEDLRGQPECDSYTVQTYTVPIKLDSVSPGPAWTFSEGGPSIEWEGMQYFGRPLALAVGDLDGDGVDEIVLSTISFGGGFSDYRYSLNLLKLEGTTLALTGSGAIQGIAAPQGSYSLDFSSLSEVTTAVEVGSVAGAPPGAIVVTTTGQNAAVFLLSSPDLQVHAPLASVSGLADAICLADLAGEAVRVGPPAHFLRSNVAGPLAVINQIPVETGQNVKGSVAFNMSQTGEQGNSVSVDVQSSWSLSDEFKAGGAFEGLSASIEKKVENSYGQNFSNAYGQKTTISTGLSATATDDDVLIMSVTEFDAWEYPVFTDASGAPSGHLLVLFPNGESAGVLVTEAKRLDSGYVARHENGRVISYPMLMPTDIANAVFVGNEVSVGLNATSWQLAWGTNTESNAQNSSQTSTQTDISKGVSLSLFEANIGMTDTFKGSYSQTSLSTHQVSLEQSLELTISFGTAANLDATYNVQPLVYWSSAGGHLTVDYVVELPHPVPAYFAQTYADPNPTFPFQWADGTSGDQWKAFTRYIQFRDDGGDVLLIATICNFSLNPAAAVEVEFFVGDPDAGGTSLGSQTVDAIAATGQAAVQARWSQPQAGDHVYCRVKCGGNSVKGFNIYPSAASAADQRASVAPPSESPSEIEVATP